MMNKKGFTLIELLAIIVILGLLVGIAIPAITRNINETRDKTYSFHESDMKSAASNMMSECLKNGTENCVPESGETKTYYLSDLISSRYSDVLKDPADTNKRCDESLSYVVVKNNGTSTVDLDYSVCLVCSEYASGICEEVAPDVTCDRSSDTTEPECGTPTGASTEWINTDRLISIGCNDSGCGCSQDMYYKRFTETGKTGTITISDKSNSGNSKECPVNVYIDKEKPECTLEVEGQLGANGWYGGDTVIVRMVDRNDEYNGEELSGVATYGLGTSKANPSYNKKTSIEVSPGITTIYGYVKDNAGNENYCSVRVQYDSEKPTQSIKYGYQVYTKADMLESTSGSVINLNNITKEYGDFIGAMVYLKSNTNGISSVTFKNGSTVLATRTIANDITQMEFTFSASGVYDDISIDMGSSSNIALIDRIELLTAHMKTSNIVFNTDKNVTIYIDSLDTYSGNAQYSFDDQNTWSEVNQKTYTRNYEEIKVNSKDGSGNVSNTTTIKINNIDKLEPDSRLVITGTEGTNGWYTSDTVKLTIDPYDVDATEEYSWSDIRYFDLTTSSTKSYNSNKTLTLSDNTTGVKYYTYVIDKAGNENNDEHTIKKDNVVPTISMVAKEKTSGETIASDVWASEGLNYTFTSTSGVSGFKVYYCKDTNNTCTPDTLVGSSATLNLTALNNDIDQQYYLRYQVVSNAGLKSSVKSYKAKIDTVVPKAKVTVTRKDNGNSVSTNTWQNSGLNFKLSVDDEGISGTTIYYCVDTDNTCTPSTKATKDANITTYNTKVNDKYYFRYKIVSNAKLETTYSFYAKTDTTKPTCTLTADNSNVKFNTKTDETNGSGLASNGWDVLNGSNTATYDGSTTKALAVATFYGHVKDAAGNTNSCSLVMKKAETYYTKTTRTCKRYNYVTCSKTSSIKHWLKQLQKCERYNVKYTCSKAATYGCPSVGVMWATGTEEKDSTSCYVHFYGSGACTTEILTANPAYLSCVNNGYAPCSGGCYLADVWARGSVSKVYSCPEGSTRSGSTCYLYNQDSCPDTSWTPTVSSATYYWDIGPINVTPYSSCFSTDYECNASTYATLTEQLICHDVRHCPDGGELGGVNNSMCYSYGQYSCPDSSWTSTVESGTYLGWNGGTDSDVLSCSEETKPTCTEGTTYVSACSSAKYRCNSTLGTNKVGSGSDYYCYP